MCHIKLYKASLLSLSKITKKYHGMHLFTIDDNVSLFWETRGNIPKKKKGKQYKED